MSAGYNKLSSNFFFFNDLIIGNIVPKSDLDDEKNNISFIKLIKNYC